MFGAAIFIVALSLLQIKSFFDIIQSVPVHGRNTVTIRL